MSSCRQVHISRASALLAPDLPAVAGRRRAGHLWSVALVAVALGGCGDPGASGSSTGDPTGSGGSPSTGDPSGGTGGSPSTGDPSGGTGGSPSTSDPSGGTGGSTAAIEAPADQWTWVGFPESRCLNGTPAGIGINPHPGSSRLVIYLEGGGHCTTNCINANGSAVATPVEYGAAELANEPKIGNGGNKELLILDRDSAGNPFQDANLVYVPYCTGDAHGGTATRSEQGQDIHFWGATDMEQFLARLVPTFPDAERVWLAGTSAGSVGTIVNYDRVRTAFGVRTDVIADSGPPMDPLPGPLSEYNAQALALWATKLPEGCAACTLSTELHAYNRALDPDARYAFLSFQYDLTIGQNMFGEEADNPDVLADYKEAIDDLVDTLAQEPNARTFIVDNTIDQPAHVVLGKSQVTAPLGLFLTAMATDDPAWSSIRLAAP